MRPILAERVAWSVCRSVAHSPCLSRDSRHSYSVGLLIRLSSHDCSCPLAPLRHGSLLTFWRFTNRIIIIIIICHTSEPCKNGFTDRAAVWVEDLGGPGNHVLYGCPDTPMGRGKWENGRPIVKYRDTLRSSVQRRLNR